MDRALALVTRRRSLVLFTVLPLAFASHATVARGAEPQNLTARAIAIVARTSELPARLAPAERRRLNEVVASLRGGRHEEARLGWSAVWKLLDDRYGIARPTEEAITSWILREAFLVPRPDLLVAADKAGFHAERRRAQSELVDALRGAARAGAANEIVIVPQVTLASTYAPNARSVLARSTNRMRRASCLEAARHADKSLKAIEVEAQLANVDLQNMLQKYPQTVELMSNVSKMLHDTAQSVIRSIAS